MEQKHQRPDRDPQIAELLEDAFIAPVDIDVAAAHLWAIHRAAGTVDLTNKPAEPVQRQRRGRVLTLAVVALFVVTGASVILNQSALRSDSGGQNVLTESVPSGVTSQEIQVSDSSQTLSDSSDASDLNTFNDGNDRHVTFREEREEPQIRVWAYEHPDAVGANPLDANGPSEVSEDETVVDSGTVDSGTAESEGVNESVPDDTSDAGPVQPSPAPVPSTSVTPTSTPTPMPEPTVTPTVQPQFEEGTDQSPTDGNADEPVDDGTPPTEVGSNG